MEMTLSSPHEGKVRTAKTESPAFTSTRPRHKAGEIEAGRGKRGGSGKTEGEKTYPRPAGPG